MKLAKHNLTGQQVAIKIVDKLCAPQLVREIETWRQLRHPNIAQLYEGITSETKIYMVQEYCGGGEMLDWDAPKGGFLIQASVTQGAVAARGMLNWLNRVVSVEQKSI